MKEDINNIINTIKLLGIDMIDAAHSGHPGIVLGAAPILYTLYANHLNINPSDPKWVNRDRFVMSPGHGSALLYATLFMAGYDLDCDQTQTFVYACLVGVAVNGLLKQAGIKFGVKFANGVIKKIPGKVLTKINQKVGFRFITKFGSKGIVNLGKMLPGVGAIVGGGLDLVETKIIADRAYKWFVKGDFSVKGDNDEGIIDIDEDEQLEDN